VKYYIIAGERSGDLHGSNLVKALRKKQPHGAFRGFGGDEMQREGVTLSVHYREMAFMGFISLTFSLFKIFKYIRYCKQDILAYKPDAVILIDYGGFNLKIARFAKANGFKVFYYIPPKVWAWYQNRALKLKARVHRIFVILPFEKEFFKKYDCEVDYVGNPVLDAIKSFQPNKHFLEAYPFAADKKIVALLPGSRKIELKRIVPLMAQVAAANPSVQFAVAAVSNLPESLYAPLANRQNVTFVKESTYDLLLKAQAAIVTSGTATLETALFKVPQVVVYRTGIFEYLIAKWLVRVKFISLVNLIADKEVIKELIQQEANFRIVNEELNRLLNDTAYTEQVKHAYEQIYKTLNTGSASDNTAQLILDNLKD